MCYWLFYTGIRCFLLCSSVRFIWDSFYLLTSWSFEKDSTCVSHLPFAINVTPDLSVIQKCICPHKYFVLVSFLGQVLRHRMENKTFSWSILGLQAKRNWAGKTKTNPYGLFPGEVGRWGGGEAPSRGPTPFIYHFWQKSYLFCILSIDKWFPFHIPCLIIYYWMATIVCELQLATI